MSYPTNHPGDKVESHIQGSGVPTALLSKSYSTESGLTTSVCPWEIPPQHLRVTFLKCTVVLTSILRKLEFQLQSKKNSSELCVTVGSQKYSLMGPLVSFFPNI